MPAGPAAAAGQQGEKTAAADSYVYVRTKRRNRIIFLFCFPLAAVCLSRSSPKNDIINNTAYETDSNIIQRNQSPETIYFKNTQRIIL